MTGCMTWSGEEQEDQEGEGALREEFRMGHVKKNSYPLPSMTPVYLDKIRGNRRISSRLVYRGWDMNDDGRFDMLESIDSAGKVLFRAFDLDFDGVVDEVKQVSKGGKGPAPGAALDKLLQKKEKTATPLP